MVKYQETCSGYLEMDMVWGAMVDSFGSCPRLSAVSRFSLPDGPLKVWVGKSTSAENAHPQKEP